MSKVMFFPWTGVNTPMPPKGWAIGGYSGKVAPFICVGCKKHIKRGQQYVYSYQNKVTTIVHNKKKCWANRG